MVSAEFGVSLLVSPFGYHSDISVWCDSMLGAVHWPLNAFSKLQVIHNMVADSSGLGCSQGGPSCSAKLAFISTWVLGCVSKHPKSLQDPLLPWEGFQLWVGSPVRARTGGSWLMFLSHNDVCVCVCVCVSLKSIEYIL